jgi:hypothetical protein
MKIEDLNTLIYAQGWMDIHIETHNDPFDSRESDAYRAEVQKAWEIVSTGLDQLVRENNNLRTTLALIDQARNAQL